MIRSFHLLATRRNLARRTRERRRTGRLSREAGKVLHDFAHRMRMARTDAFLASRGRPTYTARGARLQPIPQPSQE